MPTAPATPKQTPPTGQEKPPAPPTGENGQKKDEKPPETKADRFRRIAGKRTGEALAAIEKVGHTSRSATYEYTDEQVDKIVSALHDKVDSVEQALKNGGDAAT